MLKLEELARQGDWNALIEVFEKECSDAEVDWFSLFWRGYAAFRTDDFVTAWEIGKVVYEQQPECLEVADFVCVLSVLLGQTKDAYFYMKMKNVCSSDEVLRDFFDAEPLPDAGALLADVVEMPLLNHALLALGEGDLDSAEKWFLQQLRLHPLDAFSHISFVHCLVERERYRSALDALRSALVVIPDNADLYKMMASVLDALGKRDQAKSAYRMAISIAKKKGVIEGLYAYSFIYDAEATESEKVARCREWGQVYGLPERRSPIAVSEVAKRSKLVIGFILTDFENQRGMPALARMLSFKDEDAFKYIGYGGADITSAQYQPLQSSFDEWRSLEGVLPATLRNMVAADGVDILINLSGFRDPLFLATFGARMAPVQMLWFDSWYGTGLNCADYLLTDHSAQGALEKVVSLPSSSSLVGRRPLDTLQNTREDMRKTFIADVVVRQLTPRTLEVWAHLLNKHPDSVLVLRDHDFFSSDNATDLIERFGNYGLAHRIDIVAEADRRLFFLNGDVALLPVGDVGVDVVLDALEVGVPVVACGELGGSSIALKKLYEVLGVQEELYASDLDAYLSKCGGFLGDEGLRAEFSLEVRRKLDETPYFDYRARMTEFEQLLKDVWAEQAVS
ncbi:hypothetical protein [Terasakiella pusilla]|uniref:tetratricopeptide repeat protein n=1 Tax=Terasakiella pusilla TaxID=64973 RepID=UPI003AA8CA58